MWASAQRDGRPPNVGGASVECCSANCENVAHGTIVEKTTRSSQQLRGRRIRNLEVMLERDVV